MNGMNNISKIRERLGLTQLEMAKVIGRTQAGVSFYENGQPMPPKVAKKLIAYAKTRKVIITFNDIYS